MSCIIIPGMEISFVIKFSIEAKFNYSYDLMVLTECEKFIVPITAIDCRSILYFLDVVHYL